MLDLGLAGFSEGDSSFQIRLTKPNEEKEGKGKGYNHVSTTYELTQTRLDLDLFNRYESIMITISLFIWGRSPRKTRYNSFIYL